MILHTSAVREKPKRVSGLVIMTPSWNGRRSKDYCHRLGCREKKQEISDDLSRRILCYIDSCVASISATRLFLPSPWGTAPRSNEAERKAITNEGRDPPTKQGRMSHIVYACTHLSSKLKASKMSPKYVAYCPPEERPKSLLIVTLADNA